MLVIRKSTGVGLRISGRNGGELRGAKKKPCTGPPVSPAVARLVESTRSAPKTDTKKAKAPKETPNHLTHVLKACPPAHEAAGTPGLPRLPAWLGSSAGCGGGDLPPDYANSNSFCSESSHCPSLQWSGKGLSIKGATFAPLSSHRCLIPHDLDHTRIFTARGSPTPTRGCPSRPPRRP